MNLVELQRRLLAAARHNPPSDRVPLAFEKRIMALLPAQPLLDVWALWARALWRAAAPCAVIMLVLVAWSLFTPAQAPSGDLEQDVANSLVASVIDQDGPGS